MNIPENKSTIFSITQVNQFDSNNEIKRRKAQEINRVYVCNYKNCGKAYGSYPALYTHIKFKHQNAKQKSYFLLQYNSFLEESTEKQNLKDLNQCSNKEKSENQAVTSSSSKPQKKQHLIVNNNPMIKLDYRTINELYSDLLQNLQAIIKIHESNNTKTNEVSPALCSLESLSEEFPCIQQLNQDILFPLKTELLSLTSPQTFVQKSAQSMGIEHKSAEILAFLGTKLNQEMYCEFCYFLGFFTKCIALRKIKSIETAEEDFQQIYEYIHDSIGYCTTFRFKYLKNGKILENKNELAKLIKEIIAIIILLTLQDEKNLDRDFVDFVL